MNRGAPVARRLFDSHNMDYDPIYEFDAPRHCNFGQDTSEEFIERNMWFKVTHPTHEPENVDNLLKSGHGGHTWRLSRRGEEPIDMNSRETAALEEEFRFLLQKARLLADLDPTGFNPDTFFDQKPIGAYLSTVDSYHSQPSRKSIGGHISPKSLNLKGGARRVPVGADVISKENASANDTVFECSTTGSPSGSTTPKKAHPTSRLLSTPPRGALPPAASTSTSTHAVLPPSPAKTAAPVVAASAKSPARGSVGMSPRGALSPRSLKLGAPQRVKVAPSTATGAVVPTARVEPAPSRKVAAMHFCAAPGAKKP